MSSANDWQNLLTTALLGTERRPVTPASNKAIGALLAHNGEDAPEQTLLHTAAALTQYRRVGYVASVDSGALPEAAGTETLQPCVPRAARQLGQLLNGHHRDLLPEWLQLAAEAYRHVPATYLPALLELGRTQHTLRPRILHVLGERGRWLAAQNEEWAYAVETETANAGQTWETADRATRLALLQRLRTSQPDAARALIEATWSTEKADDRTAFLQPLETGLGMGDEPMLEAALDDRSTHVRRTAADLLVRLPESRLVARMRERASALISFKRRLLRSTVIELRLPEACDTGMQRDGIETKARGTLGEKAWWLHQMLVAIAPWFWSQHWNATPAEIISAAAQSEWKELLLNAWVAAAVRHSDTDWAEALLTLNVLPVNAEFETLVQILSTERRERFVGKLLRGDSPLAPTMLRQCTHAWSESFARAAMAWFRAQITGSRPSNWLVLTLLKESARFVPPALAAEFGQGWPTEAANWQSWQGAVDRFLVVLQFRAEMHKALIDT